MAMLSKRRPGPVERVSRASAMPGSASTLAPMKGAVAVPPITTVPSTPRTLTGASHLARPSRRTQSTALKGWPVAPWPAPATRVPRAVTGVEKTRRIGAVSGAGSASESTAATSSPSPSRRSQSKSPCEQRRSLTSGPAGFTVTVVSGRA
ncbi:hypothetical protein EXY23_05975 [Roseicella aquatilis]|uniref:Uncharacterized protein n=1 Tax=Roseicella aquatilis TaxID=2527868 RepID=A0A4V2WLV6_9PROT|nr:hypothetical protein EXY23_05975 [Roseicella aquatilis]